MTLTATLESSQMANDRVIFPEGEFWSDEPPLESNLHLRQILLLIQCLEWFWQDREDFLAAGNLTIYYSPKQKKSEDFRGPDFFLNEPCTLNPSGIGIRVLMSGPKVKPKVLPKAYSKWQ